MNQASKEKILKEAYRLFAEKTYEKVTFKDLEIKTDFTRGGLVQHVKNKNNLFKEVFNKYMLSDTSIVKSLKENEYNTLYCFIDVLISWIKIIKADMAKLGINNYNWAYVNLTYQAKFYYPNFTSEAKEWEDLEIDIWKKVISNAIENNEISQNCDVDILANTFHNLYIGYSYSGIILPNGVDLEKMENSMKFIYSTIKK